MAQDVSVVEFGQFFKFLKLELAAFRDLEIFASFSNDLDPTTLAIITRGARLVELLKQDPHKPRTFEEELILIFAGRNSLLNELPVEAVEIFKERVSVLF
nr:hypothetical protein [bacterium]